MYLPYQRSKDGSTGVLEVQNIAPEEERCWFLGDEVVSGELVLSFPSFPLVPRLRMSSS